MSEIEESPEFRGIIAQLEALKRTSKSGVDYWMARDINDLLGYPTWREFESVVERARGAMRNNDIDPSHQIVLTHKMMEVGKGARVQGDDYFLTRGACRLIAMNGDPNKVPIAAAQAYFLVQTHRMEQEDALRADEERLRLREKVKVSHKSVSEAAQAAGVRSHMQGVFHDMKYQGLYEMSLQMVKASKGLGPKETLYDRAGPLELSMHDFQMELAAEAIRNEGIRGEQPAIRKNKQVAQEVRKLVIEQGKTLPENLPLASEPIAEVRKRVEAQKKLTAKTDPNV